MNITPVQLFKSLSDPTRLRCLALLAKTHELCVCEITEALLLPQPKVSHHLSNLRKNGLVSDRKAGLWIYYQINPELPQWVNEMILIVMQGIKNEAPYLNDETALTGLINQDNNRCSD